MKTANLYVYSLTLHAKNEYGEGIFSVATVHNVPYKEEPSRHSATISIQNVHICLITIQDVWISTSLLGVEVWMQLLEHDFQTGASTRPCCAPPAILCTFESLESLFVCNGLFKCVELYVAHWISTNVAAAKCGLYLKPIHFISAFLTLQLKVCVCVAGSFCPGAHNKTRLAFTWKENELVSKMWQLFEPESYFSLGKHFTELMQFLLSESAVTSQ